MIKQLPIDISKQIRSIAGVILAGGQSSRMGTDKSKLVNQDQTLLACALKTMINAGITSVFISGKDSILDSHEFEKHTAIKGIKDRHVSKGPLSGISSSLEYLTPFDVIVFAPVDMPMLTERFYLEMASNMKDHLIIYYEDYYLPFMIRNQIGIRDKIKCHINNNHLSLKNFFSAAKAHSLTNNHAKGVFTNLNTPSDWLKFTGR